MRINGTVEDNFWECNPELKIPEVFASLYKSDKSKQKEDSSRIMWGIYLIYHTSSKFYNLPQEEKEKLVTEDFIKKKDFKWSSVKKEINEFQRFVLTAAKRQLLQWDRLMDEKTEFMKNMKYKEDTCELLEKLITSNTKLYAEYDRISKMLEEEGEEGVTKGGGEESAQEKNLI